MYHKIKGDLRPGVALLLYLWDVKDVRFSDDLDSRHDLYCHVNPWKLQL